MRKRRHLAGVVAAAMVAAVAMVVPTVASADEWERFDNCPSTNVEVKRCIYSTVEGGEFVLGKKKVPIVNPVTLQGGYGKATAFVSNFFAATNGETLSKSPQPVPGGLAGLVNCKEISNWVLRGSCELVFENGLTGVNSTLELALPASEIRISEINLLFEEGTALKLPVKAHLENPLLGSSCYIGSSASPIWLELTTGTTAPPAPAAPISGSAGTSEFLEEGKILKLSNTKLVDNAWSAPGAEGCGGPVFKYILDPIINLSVGVPSAAGKNSAIQTTTAYTATAASVNAN